MLARPETAPFEKMREPALPIARACRLSSLKGRTPALIAGFRSKIMLRSFIVCGLLSVIGCAREEQIAVELIPLPNPQPVVLVGEASPAGNDPLAALTVATSETLGSASSVPVEPERATTARPLASSKPVQSAPPHLAVASKRCESPPPPCAGAIGFCPSWDCVDGKWVSKPRPNRVPCAGTLEACSGVKSKPGDSL